jgi:hypothetical protein
MSVKAAVLAVAGGQGDLLIGRDAYKSVAVTSGADADGQIPASSPVADPLPPQGQDDNNDDYDDDDRPDTDIHG